MTHEQMELNDRNRKVGQWSTTMLETLLYTLFVCVSIGHPFYYIFFKYILSIYAWRQLPFLYSLIPFMHILYKNFRIHLFVCLFVCQKTVINILIIGLPRSIRYHFTRIAFTTNDFYYLWAPFMCLAAFYQQSSSYYTIAQQTTNKKTDFKSAAMNVQRYCPVQSQVQVQ